MSDLEPDPLYTDSYLDDEPTSSKREEGNNDSLSHSLQSPPFELDEESKDSYTSALENTEEVSLITPSGPATEDVSFVGGVPVTCMSTIEEESKTYETSTATDTAPTVSRSLNPVAQELAISEEVRDDSKNPQPIEPVGRDFDKELEELKRFVERTAGSDLTSPNLPSSSPVPSFNNEPLPSSSALPLDPSEAEPPVNPERSDSNVELLLKKLERLESTQNILEEILNTGIPEHLDINAIIAQLPLDDPFHLLKDQVDEEDQQTHERSVSSEIASIQKLIDGVDLCTTLNSEGVAGGNNNFLEEIPLNDNIPEKIFPKKKERDVDEVLKEYEEFERSLSQASVVDDSFRSEIASFSTPSVSNKTNSAPFFPEDNYPNLPANPNPVPVIKPPVLKSVVSIPPNPPSSPVRYFREDQVKQVPPFSPSLPSAQAYQEMFAPPLSSHQSPGKNSGNASGSARTRPLTTSSSASGSKKSHKIITTNTVPTGKSSRIETSQSAHKMKPQPTSTSHSARPTTSSTATSCRDSTQDAFKPRNRRMVSPRTNRNPSQNQTSFSPSDIPMSGTTMMSGAGEGYHVPQQHQQKEYPSQHQQYQHPHRLDDDSKNSSFIAAEAMKTIEKLNTMVARQETLLEAYAKDNDRLWTQLKESKTASSEKEAEFQDVIGNLKTEVASLKLNKLMASPRQKSLAVSLDEVQRLREESDLKSHQVMELRKEIILLQSKLGGMPKSPKPKQNPSVMVAQEKEKEYQKQIAALGKQVRTLQKILYSKDQTAPPAQPSSSGTSQNLKTGQSARSKSMGMQRTQSSDAGFKTGSANVHSLLKGAKSTGVDSFPKRPASSPVKQPMLNIKTGDILQASLNCLEQERDEFENTIAEKNKLIFEKEKMILNLRSQLESLNRSLPGEGEVVERGLIDELRSRIITQNKVIQQLKEHLSTFKKIESENIVLREEKMLLEDHVTELRRKLEFSQSLRKPENEVLCLLSEKVDELNSRYYHRERQLDTLLNRLTLKTTTGTGGGISIGGSASAGGVMSNSSTSNSSSSSAGISRPLLMSSTSPMRRMDQFNNNNGSLGKNPSAAIIPTDILHMVDFSPSASFQLDVEM